MKEYKLVLSTYNITQTLKVDLTPKEAELMEDITSSLKKQKANILLEVILI